MPRVMGEPAAEDPASASFVDSAILKEPEVAANEDKPAPPETPEATGVDTGEQPKMTP